MSNQWLVLSIALVFQLTAGCSSSSDSGSCTPGAQVACACPGGTQSVQICNAEGTGWGSCACGKNPGADGGITAYDGGSIPTGECKWPGTQTDEKFGGALHVDFKDDLYIVRSEGPILRIACQTGQVETVNLPYTPSWSTTPVMLVVGNRHVLGLSPKGEEHGLVAIFDPSWNLIKTLDDHSLANAVLDRAHGAVDTETDTFYASFEGKIMHYDRDGSLLASYNDSDCFPLNPAGNGAMFCFPNIPQIPKLFKDGKVTDIPGMLELKKYQIGGGKGGVKYLGGDGKKNILIAHGDETYIQFEKRDANGSVTWTSEKLDHEWNCGMAEAMRRGTADKDGNVLVGGFTASGLPSKPSVDHTAFFYIMYRGTDGKKLWSHQSPNFATGAFAFSLAFTSKGNVFVSRNRTEGLKKLEPNGFEIGSSR